MSTAWLTLDDRQTPLPAGWEPLTGHRDAEWWTWRLIDRATGRHLGDLDGVEGGSLSLNVNADTRGTGSLSWSGWLDDMPRWRETRVQPVYSARLMDSSVASWPMGVYLCSSPSTDYSFGGHVQTSVQLYDRTLILRRAKFVNTEGVRAGEPVVPHVRGLISTYNAGPSALEDSGATLRSSIVWDAGTEVLRAVNDLLEAAGMVALWADPDGALRSSPSVRPQDRPLVWGFKEGVKAIHGEQVTHDFDDFEVPNRVTAIIRAEPGVPTLRAKAELPPSHPLSYASTGEWVDRTEPEVEATSLEVLAERAQRWLTEGASVTSSATVTHRPVPLGLLDRVSLDSGGLVMPSATVQTIDIQCTPGDDWKTRIREVAQ